MRIPVKLAPQLTLRQKIWKTFEEPMSSRLAMVVATLVVVAILASVVAFIVQSLPQYVWSTASSWTAVEATCITIFTTEFLLRIGSCPSVWAFLKGESPSVWKCRLCHVLHAVLWAVSVQCT